jgi:hypothetical protein
VSPEVVTLLLVCCAASIAHWIIARFTDFGPRSMRGAIIHVVAAIVLIVVLLSPVMDALGASGIPGALYVQLFGVALPLLVYAFLGGGWVTKVALGLLR